MGKAPHAQAFVDKPINELHSKNLDATLGVGFGVVSLVSIMGKETTQIIEIKHDKQE